MNAAYHVAGLASNSVLIELNESIKLIQCTSEEPESQRAYLRIS